MLPECPAQWTHPDRCEGGSGDGGGTNGVGGGSSTGRDNDLRCRWRSHLLSLSLWGGNGRGRDDDDGGQKGGRGDGEASSPRLLLQRRGGEATATARRLLSQQSLSVFFGLSGKLRLTFFIFFIVFTISSGSLYVFWM